MSKDWQDLSVLLAGCGSIGKRHARVLAGIGIKDIRACDLNADRTAGLLEETPQVRIASSFEQGLADKPVVVFVLTPPKMHVPMTSQALAAGCHVFCEKPLSDNLDGVPALLNQTAVSDRKVMVGLCFRYHEGLLRAKNLLDAGKIGRLVSIRALMGEHFPDVRPDYRTLFTSRYSGAFDLSHDVDLALWYADQPVADVQCVSGTFSDIDIEASDIVEMLIRFADRCVAGVHLDFFQRPRRRQMELIGTEGVVIVEFASWDKCTVSIFRASTGEWASETIRTRRDDMFEAEDREFLLAVAEGHPVRCDIHEGLKSLEVLARAQSGGAQPDIADLIRKIKLLALDFDGVFTDNRVHVNQEGVEAVSCWRGDGLGLKKLDRLGIDTVIISTETNPVVSARSRKHGIRCIQGVDDKVAELRRMADESGLSMDQIGFVGNDTNDLPVLRAVGLPIVVNDAHPCVVPHALYRTNARGGQGAVREVCDLFAGVLSQD